MKPSAPALLLAASLPVALIALPALAQPRLRPLAVTGVSAGPLAPRGAGAGVRYSTLATPTVTTDGRILFRATLAGDGVTLDNDSSLWFGPVGTATLAVREGDPAPDQLLGVLFGEIADRPNASPDDVLAFLVSLTGPGISTGNDLALYRGTPVALRLEAQEGNAAPELVGPLIDDFIRPILIDSIGTIGFGASLRGSGVATRSDFGIFATDTTALNPLRKLIRTGDPAPTLAGISFARPVAQISRSGARTCFRTGLAGTGVDATNNEAIWSMTPIAVNPSLIARRGSQAGGFPSTVRYASLGIPTAGGIYTAFAGTITGLGVTLNVNDRCIWVGAEGSLQIVARSGSPLPGAGFNVSLFNGVRVLNDSGHLVFGATLSGAPTSSDTGFWRYQPGSIVPLVREGDIPANAPGVAISAPGIDSFCVTPDGSILFTTQLSGAAVNADNDFAIARFTPGLGLNLLAREGSPLTIGPGDVRTIASANFFVSLASGADDGRPSALDADANAVILLNFSDGSAAIAISSDVPICPADFNDDGFVDFFDADDFSLCFDGGACPPGKDGDFNADGFVDFFDFGDFVAAFETGC
jgi:hypothetical protein